jgi:hypothetical protein
MTHTSNKIWRKGISSITIVMAIVAGVFLLCCERKGPAIIAMVGEIPIYQDDIEYRIRTYGKCYGRENIDELFVLAECIRDGFELAVLESYFNMEPTESLCALKVKWIDENTKDPPTWDCIKETYSKHEDALFRNVVRPIIVNQQLHGLFSMDTLIHRRERDSIRSIMREVVGERIDFESINGYDTFFTWRRDRDDSSINVELQEFGENLFVEEVLKKLSSGELWQDIVEGDYTYSIVKSIEVNDTGYLWCGVVLQKGSFDEWFINFARQNIKIEIRNSKLFVEFKAQYEDIWWRDCFVVCKGG